MAVKKPIGMSQLFAPTQQAQEVLGLKDRVAELEAEIEQLRSKAQSHVNATELEQKIAELTKELAQRSGVHEIPIEKIHPDPDQPRTIFPQSVIESRAKSLREEGQLTPVILIPLENGEYRLFEGELRWRSAPFAGMTHLKAVFRAPTDDPVATFDRQMTTSIQTEKLHGLDLANGLLRLLSYKYPEFKDRLHEVPGILNAAIQRLKRMKKLSELDRLQTATAEQQQQWLDLAGLRDEEKKILLVVLGKQLNPASVNANILPLIKLPKDVQQVMERGLDASKARVLAKLTPERLRVETSKAIALRESLATEALDQNWSLSQLQHKVQEVISKSNFQFYPNPRLRKTIQQVQALKIDIEDDANREQLKELERALQEKLKQVRNKMQSLQG